jgi:hypothetical protein
MIVMEVVVDDAGRRTQDAGRSCRTVPKPSSQRRQRLLQQPMSSNNNWEPSVSAGGGVADRDDDQPETRTDGLMG